MDCGTVVRDLNELFRGLASHAGAKPDSTGSDRPTTSTADARSAIEACDMSAKPPVPLSESSACTKEEQLGAGAGAPDGDGAR